jgi:hypothetical protein
MSFSHAVLHGAANRNSKNAAPFKKLAKLCFDLENENGGFPAYLDRLVQATKQKPKLAKFIGAAVAAYSSATLSDPSVSSSENISFRNFAKLCWDLWEGGRRLH